MKYIFICFCVVLTACVLNEKQNNFLEFSSIPKKYFEKYSPNIENYINKEQAKYSHVYINKSEMSLGDFEKIKENILKDNWVVKNNNKHYYEFCLDKNLYMSVLYPDKNEIQYKSTGTKVTYQYLNKWLIIISYNQFGTSTCK